MTNQLVYMAMRHINKLICYMVSVTNQLVYMMHGHGHWYRHPHRNGYGDTEILKKGFLINQDPHHDRDHDPLTKEWGRGGGEEWVRSIL